jgi:hypothetical protein
MKTLSRQRDDFRNDKHAQELTQLVMTDLHVVKADASVIQASGFAVKRSVLQL